MTATERAMAPDEWEHMDAKDARIRELEAEVMALRGELEVSDACGSGYMSALIFVRGLLRDLWTAVDALEMRVVGSDMVMVNDLDKGRAVADAMHEARAAFDEIQAGGDS